jgi:DNA repair exonuclease SbcCD ATPase subunit
MDLHQRLAEKEEQLQWAAAYGQDLLNANRALQKQLKDVKNTEWALEQLQEQRQTLEKERSEIQDQLNKALEQKGKLSDQCSELERLIGEQESVIVALEQEKLAHAEDQEKLLEQVQYWKHQATKVSPRDSIDLQNVVLEYQDEIKKLQEELLEAKSHSVWFEHQIQDLNAMLEQQAEMKEENEDLKLQLEAANIHAEALDETIQQLKEQLNVPKTDGVEDAGGKTLLCEVEDKRQELQKSHQDLTRKHHGLLKKHSHSVHEKQRLQQHLAQMAHRSQRPSSDIVKRLEAALAQAQSEKHQLEAKIALLQKEPPVAILSEDMDAMTQYLKSRIDMLQNRVNELEATNRTMSLMRENDAKKLLAAERLLDEKTMALDNLQQDYFVLKQRSAREKEECLAGDIIPIEEFDKENSVPILPVIQPEIMVPLKVSQKPNGPKRIVRRKSDDCKQQ